MMRKCKQWINTWLVLCGVLALGLFALAFTSFPPRIFAWFGAPGDLDAHEPTMIVILGGGGIPSESGLMRCYIGAMVAHQHKKADVMICLPTELEIEDSSVAKMREELLRRGIRPERIRLEHKATTTHAQAVAVAGILRDEGRIDDEVVVVSSGYHLRRAIGCFRKAGVSKAVARVPVNVPDEYDLGDNVQLRYRFWNNMHMMVISAREACAIALYKLRGHL